MSVHDQISILVATIGALALIIAALIGVGVPALVSTRRHSKAASDNTAETRDELKNSHEVNLRDDLDAKFAGVNSRLDRQGRQIGRLFRITDELEDTVTKPRPQTRRRK